MRCGTCSQTLILADDQDAQAIADRTEQEMKIITANFEYCGYEFYIFQKERSN